MLTVPVTGVVNPLIVIVWGSSWPTSASPSNTVRLRSGSDGERYTTTSDQPA